MENLFYKEIEDEAITRIKKFAKLAKSMNMEVAIGFSGGKDSLVVYDLCKRAGIDCKFYFNHALEDTTTIQYIKSFGDVIRRRVAVGFFEHLQKNINGLLPTPTTAWCCEMFKHNPKFIDDCVILGVRKVESAKRKERKVFEAKNKTFLKKNKALIDEYFSVGCQGSTSNHKISLMPIVDWSDDDVWQYIKKYNLRINPLYEQGFHRVGCMICPKANFTRNFEMLMKYPKLVNCVIGAIERSNGNRDLRITSDDKDYTNDKVYYVCRWLNHGFMPFTKKQEVLYEQFRKKYENRNIITNIQEIEINPFVK